MTFFEGGVVGRQVRLTCFDVTEDVVACGVSGFGFDTLAEGRRVSVSRTSKNERTRHFSYRFDCMTCILESTWDVCLELQAIFFASILLAHLLTRLSPAVRTKGEKKDERLVQFVI